MRTAALPSPRTRTSGTSAKYDMPLPGDGDFLFSSVSFSREAILPFLPLTRRTHRVAAMSRMATPRGESEPMASPQV